MYGARAPQDFGPLTALEVRSSMPEMPKSSASSEARLAQRTASRLRLHLRSPSFDGLVQAFLRGGREVLDHDDPNGGGNVREPNARDPLQDALPFDARRDHKSTFGQAIIEEALRRSDREALASLSLGAVKATGPSCIDVGTDTPSRIGERVHPRRPLCVARARRHAHPRRPQVQRSVDRRRPLRPRRCARPLRA